MRKPPSKPCEAASKTVKRLAVGSVSWITYADRLMEFPTAMLGVAMGVVLVLTQCLNIWLVPIYQHAALTLTIGVGAMVNALWLLMGLLRRGSYKPEPGWAVFAMQVIAACALLAVFLMWANSAFPWTQMQGENFKRIGLLALILCASAAIYFVALWAGGLKLRQFVKR